MFPLIFNLLISLALSAASSLIQQIFAQDQKQTQQGVRGSIQTGGDNPLAFIMGRYGTAGQLEYVGTWGNDGDTPNAYFTKVISVSDLPVRALAGLFVGSERVTILTGGGAMGAPVEQYRVDGKDHLWVKFYDGNQTLVDGFLLEKFGSDPDRPWQSDMIGRGVAYVIITALVNRELFSGLPDYLIEVDGIPLNDRRGGSAQHDNPMVGIDHVLGGLYFDGQWVYGPQSISANRRPIATWRTQMDKCDVILDDAKTYRFGYEVVVDQQPQAVIGEYLKACAGRIAEIGGIYKPLVGGPDAPVVSFTDEDIVITEGQSFDPFPGLEATYNAMTGTYPEPTEAWENKEAPPRYRSDLELLDDNRRLPFSTTYAAVPYAEQVQHLMRAAIEETRRFRRHVHTMPPEWWEFEPLDAAAWSSDRHSYENKIFLITAQDDLGNGNQVPALQEQDPADYDWSSGYVLPWDVVPISIVRPAPQEVKGFYVEPIAGRDNEGKARRPGIRIHWNGEQPDVRTIKLTIRLDEGDVPVWEGRPVNFADGVADVLGDPLLASTAYEVQGEYEPFGSRPTVPTGWLKVTTPYIALSLIDVDEEFRNVVSIITGMGEGSLSERLQELYDRLAKLAATEVSATVVAYTERRELEAKQNEDRAYFLEQVTVLVDADQALATLVTVLEATFNDNAALVTQQLTSLATADQTLATNLSTVETNFNNNAAIVAQQLQAASNANSATAGLVQEVQVQVNGVTANGLRSTVATAGPSGWQVKIADIVRVSANGQFYEAGWYTLVNSNGDNVFAVKANSFYFLDNTGNVITSPFYISGGTVYIKTAVIEDLTIGTNKITDNAVTDNFSAQDNAAIDVRTSSQVIMQCNVYVPTAQSLVYLFASTTMERIDTSDGTQSYVLLRRAAGGLQEKNSRFAVGASGNTQAHIPFMLTDAPGVGWQTYELVATGNYARHGNRVIVAMVRKK